MYTLRHCYFHHPHSDQDWPVNVCLLGVQHHVLNALHMVRPRYSCPIPDGKKFNSIQYSNILKGQPCPCTWLEIFNSLHTLCPFLFLLFWTKNTFYILNIFTKWRLTQPWHFERADLTSRRHRQSQSSKPEMTMSIMFLDQSFEFWWLSTMLMLMIVLKWWWVSIS